MPTKKAPAKQKAKPRAPAKKKAPAKAKPRAKPPAKKAAAPKKKPTSTQKKVSEIMVLDLDQEDLETVFSALGPTIKLPEDIFHPTIRNARLHPIMALIKKNPKTKFSTKASSELRVRSYRNVFGIPKNLKIS